MSRANLKEILYGDINLLLVNPIYREALRVANPTCFDEKETIDSNMQSTVRNYLKRMSARPVPYSLFSAVGMGNLLDNPIECKKKIYEKRGTVDYAWLLMLLKQIEKRNSIRIHPDKTFW